MAKPFCTHIHIYCQNLEDMISFWSDIFGATLVRRRKFGPDDGAVMDMGLNTELYLKAIPCSPQSSADQRAGIDHFGMQVENLDAFLKSVAGKPHVKILREPFLSGAMRCAFISGPEGTRVEVMEPAT